MTVTAALGPSTEARLAALFADCAVATAKATAAFLGMDVKTLDALADAGAIRAVRRGAGQARGYTEGDIRAYLTESAAPERHAKPGRSTVRGQVVQLFSERKTRSGGR